MLTNPLTQNETTASLGKTEKPLMVHVTGENKYANLLPKKKLEKIRVAVDDAALVN